MLTIMDIHSTHLLAAREIIPTFTSIPEMLEWARLSAFRIVASKHMTYAFFTLLIYDHGDSVLSPPSCASVDLISVLTLPEEIKLTWFGRPSFVKTLFLFNRYMAPLFIAIDVATLSGTIRVTDKVGTLSPMSSIDSPSLSSCELSALFAYCHSPSQLPLLAHRRHRFRAPFPPNDNIDHRLPSSCSLREPKIHVACPLVCMDCAGHGQCRTGGCTRDHQSRT